MILAAHKQFLTAYNNTIIKVHILHCDNYDMVYLGEVSWKVPVAPQVETRDAWFKIECLMAVQASRDREVKP